MLAEGARVQTERAKRWLDPRRGTIVGVRGGGGLVLVRWDDGRQSFVTYGALHEVSDGWLLDPDPTADFSRSTVWLGLEVGTTKSSAALVLNDRVVQVRESNSPNPYFATSVLLHPSLGLLSGNSAESLKRRFPERFRDEIKRFIGQRDPMWLGGTPVTVAKALESLLLGIKREADRMAGTDIDSVVMTRPVDYSDERSAVLAEAARAIGFRSVVWLREPEAAALYHVENDDVSATGRHTLVYDFGGGTFDAILLRIGENGPGDPLTRRRRSLWRRRYRSSYFGRTHEALNRLSS